MGCVGLDSTSCLSLEATRLRKCSQHVSIEPGEMTMLSKGSYVVPFWVVYSGLEPPRTDLQKELQWSLQVDTSNFASMR